MVVPTLSSGDTLTLLLVWSPGGPLCPTKQLRPLLLHAATTTTTSSAENVGLIWRFIVVRWVIQTCVQYSGSQICKLSRSKIVKTIGDGLPRASQSRVDLDLDTCYLGRRRIAVWTSLTKYCQHLNWDDNGLYDLRRSNWAASDVSRPKE